ncbi:hypothetical protein Tco_1241646 [Tanacetum coccineum]
MHGDKTPNAYLNRAQEYADALATIGEPVKDKDRFMLAVSGLRKEYNGLKTTITARQSPTAFSELHALLSDHDYMLGKTRLLRPSLHLLLQTSELHALLKSFVQMVERQFTTKLKNVQTDWGEHRNRHVVETGLTLLAQACVP